MSTERRPIQISPSLLSADWSRLAEEVRAVERAGADSLHMDVMDGHFVPNLTFGPVFVEAVHRLTTLPLITHLMMTDPVPFVSRFARAGSAALIVHVEALPDPRPALAAVRALGVRAGVTLNPDTPFSAVAPYLAHADVFLVMSVQPGFGGQAFRPEALPKATLAAALREEQGLEFEIHMDGGIDVTTAPAAAAAGVDVLVAGSAVFGAPDPGAMVGRLREAARSARG